MLKKDNFFIAFLSCLIIFQSTGPCYARSTINSHSQSEEVNLKDLPVPYNSLDELMSFDDFGWFSPGNVRVLQRLIKERKPKTIVEVGSFLGRSTIFIASRMPKDGKLYAVDHWLGSEEHQNNEVSKYLPTMYEQFLSNIIHKNLTDQVVPIRMPSLEAAESLEIKADIIFIDGDHSFEGAYNDICAWYPKLKQGGVMCGDDWKWPSVREAVVLFAQKNNLNIKAIKSCWWYEERK